MSNNALHQRVLNDEFFTAGQGAGATIRPWTGVEKQLAKEVERVKARNKHLEENLNAALVCATIGDTFKARQFMATALSTEAQS